MQNKILADTLENFRYDESVIYKCITWRWHVYGGGEEQAMESLKQATDVSYLKFSFLNLIGDSNTKNVGILCTIYQRLFQQS
jgi:hypothetical protein